MKRKWPIHKRLVYSSYLEDSSSINFDNDWAFIFHASPEERSHHLLNVLNTAGPKLVNIYDEQEEAFNVEIGNDKYEVNLWSKQRLNGFLNLLSRDKVAIDITGLSHHVWAPILKQAIELKLEVVIIYNEPKHYIKRSSGEYNLSERIKGLSPIPGFAMLRQTEASDVCFLPLLGFEENRFKYAFERVDPLVEKTFPIIGTPGFRAEYPFVTYWQNMYRLQEEDIWLNVNYAPANCPFRLFYLLDEFSKKYPQDIFKIALLGTKPHALGSVLFSLVHTDKIEFYYDLPYRSKDRSEGTSRNLCYHVSSFLKEVKHG